MIHATSRASLADSRRQFDGAAASSSSAELVALAGDLHAVGMLLGAQPQLRRALGDGSTPADSRRELIGRVLGSQLAATSVAVAQDIVALRWSSPWDLADALELTADDALLAAAEKDGRLDDVEDQLFRFERVLAGQGDLVTLLDDASAPAQRRNGLLRSLLEGKALPVTLQLLENAVSSARKRSIALAIDDLLEEAARRQERSIAKVTSATGLTEDQERRLSVTLSQMYGKPITLRVAVDPSIRGGLIIRIGDEVIDGSVAHRLAAARVGLAGT